MFRAERRFRGDLGCQWDIDDTLDREFPKLFDDCDFYALRHWFLKCATAPVMEFFYNKSLLKNHILENVRAGDGVEIWSIEEGKSVYICAKMPDKDGLIPVKNCAY